MQHHRNRGRVTIDHLENRRFLSVSALSNTTTELVEEPITIGAPSLKDITFVATNGRKTTFSVAGATAAITFPGPAALTLYKGHAFFPAGAVETISSIVVANAIPGKAALKEVGAYGTGEFNVGSIVGGDLGSINAPDVNLTGSLTVGSIKRLTLGSVSGATLSLGSSAAVVKISGPLSATVTAGSIGSLSASSISQTNITTSDPFSKSKLQIASIDGGSGILDSNIISAGNIGSVKAGFLSGTVITAAVDSGAVVPQSSLAIVAPASIRSIQLRSQSITTPAYFLDSVIAAKSIGSVQLGQINGGGGLAAQSIAGFGAMGPSGALDRFPFHLGPAQLHSAARVQDALTKLNIPFTAATADSTEFYNFDLNILG